MALFVGISNDGSYIVARIAGMLTVEDTRRAMDEVVSLITSSHITKMLIDARERQNLFSIADQYDVGEMVATQPAYRNVAIAVVVRNALTDEQFIETVARNRGANISYFNDYDQALAWLGVAPTGR